MARGLPDALRLREVKYGSKTTAEERLRWVGALLEAGRIAEALDLALIAGDEERIAAIRKRAIDEGLVYLLLALERAERPLTRSDWQAAGRAALAAGRWRDAYRAFTEAGDEDGLARVQEKLPEYALFSPQGK